MVVVTGRYGHKRCHILYTLHTLHIVTTPSTKPYSFMKIILTVFKKDKIDSIAAKTIKGK